MIWMRSLLRPQREVSSWKLTSIINENCQKAVFLQPNLLKLSKSFFSLIQISKNGQKAVFLHPYLSKLPKSCLPFIHISQNSQKAVFPSFKSLKAAKKLFSFRLNLSKMPKSCLPFVENSIFRYRRWKHAKHNDESRFKNSSIRKIHQN